MKRTFLEAEAVQMAKSRFNGMDSLQELRFYRKQAAGAFRAQKQPGWDHMALREFSTRITNYMLRRTAAIRRVRLPK